MIGSSLGLGIGLQGQPKQYAEMAYKKLASDAAVKKQQADVDKEFLNLYKDAVFVKPGYVLPAESDQYQELLATYAAKMNQKHIERDYSGAVQTLNELKMKSQPFLTNYKVVDEARKKQAELAIDSDAINTLYTTRDRNEFNKILQNPYTGIAYDTESGVISPTMFKRANIESEIKTKLLDTEFELSKTTQKDAAGKPMNMFVLPESIKAAKITNLVNDPSIRQSYMVSMQKSLDGLDSETANTMITQKINEDARAIFDRLTRYKNTSAGITVNNIMGGANREIIDIVGSGSSDINYSGTVVEATGSINLGNVKSVKAASGDMFDVDGNQVKDAGIVDFTIGTSYYVPVLNEPLTTAEIEKIKKRVTGNPSMLTLLDKLIEKRKGGTINVKNEPIPKGLDKIIAEEVPNKVSVKVLSTLKDSKEKYGEDVFMVSDVNQVEQIINNSDKTREMKINLVKELRENAKKRESELKKGSTTRQPKTSAPKTATKNEFEQYFRKK